MAIDDWQTSRIGTVGGFLTRSVTRWLDEAAASRKNNYTATHLFKTIRAQWEANWDLWNALVPFPGSPVMPTIVIRAAHNALINSRGDAFVGPQLEGRTPQDFTASAMQDFTGAHVIDFDTNFNPAIPPFTAAVTGRFTGQVQVTMAQDAPAAGVYRGIVFVTFPGGAGPEPLAWVVVVAT